MITSLSAVTRMPAISKDTGTRRLYSSAESARPNSRLTDSQGQRRKTEISLGVKYRPKGRLQDGGVGSYCRRCFERNDFDRGTDESGCYTYADWAVGSCDSGVNSLTQLKSALEDLKEGLRKINTAFDMDFSTNCYVQNGFNNLLSLLDEMGFPFRSYVWDPRYKGLDDYIWAQKQIGQGGGTVSS
ncbi:MAG: DUF3854 domain-containing protein [Coprobacter sp.]